MPQLPPDTRPIGFVTTGRMSLAQGSGRAIGAISLRSWSDLVHRPRRLVLYKDVASRIVRSATVELVYCNDRLLLARRRRVLLEHLERPPRPSDHLRLEPRRCARRAALRGSARRSEGAARLLTSSDGRRAAGGRSSGLAALALGGSEFARSAGLRRLRRRLFRPAALRHGRNETVGERKRQADHSRNVSRADRLRRLGPARLREPPRSLSRQAMAIRVGRTRRSRVVLFALVLLALLLVRRHWRSSPDVSSARTDLADRRDVALGIGEDGRLAVREGEPHPIPALMARARRQWADLRARQSKTFAQAVAEYERRHGRKPPKGFDQWYDEHPLALLTLQVCVCTAAQCPAHRRVRPDRA